MNVHGIDFVRNAYRSTTSYDGCYKGRDLSLNNPFAGVWECFYVTREGYKGKTRAATAEDAVSDAVAYIDSN